MPSILIVDDEETVRATFQDVLEAEGHQVVTASSFTEAKERLEAKRFDVALTGRRALLVVVERACERNTLLREKRRLEAENEDYQRSLEGKVRERTTRLRESEKRYRELFQETRRAYEELKEIQEKLIRSERLAAVGELAAQIAHEIRNPLGAISNSVGVLRRDLELHGDDRRLLEVVDEESQRLEGIVADFLRFARPRPIHKTPQYITEILDDLLLLVSQEPKGSKIRIEKR